MENTAKHTPGPWVITKDHAKAYAFIRPIDGEHSPIATIEWTDSGSIEANAALVAAAPDLLAALELCERALEVRDAEAEEFAAKNARAAIAKARGE